MNLMSEMRAMQVMRVMLSISAACTVGLNAVSGGWV